MLWVVSYPLVERKQLETVTIEESYLSTDNARRGTRFYSVQEEVVEQAWDAWDGLGPDRTGPPLIAVQTGCLADVEIAAMGTRIDWFMGHSRRF